MNGASNSSVDEEFTGAQNHQSVEYNRILTQLEALRTRTEYTSMKLTPWYDIWTALTFARLRGNAHMVEVFYEALFKEAVFDDRGAWTLAVRRTA